MSRRRYPLVIGEITVCDYTVLLGKLTSVSAKSLANSIFFKILFNYNTDIAIKQSKKSYLLSARSVLFPTNIIITSLPLSVLTSSIHFDVWWKEFASESQSVKVMQGQAFFGINNQKQQIYNHYHGHLAT